MGFVCVLIGVMPVDSTKLFLTLNLFHPSKHCFASFDQEGFEFIGDSQMFENSREAPTKDR